MLMQRRPQQPNLGEGITLLTAFMIGILGAMLVIVSISTAATLAGACVCVVAVVALLAGGFSVLRRSR